MSILVAFGKTLWRILLFLVEISVVIIVWFVIIYNNFVKLKNRLENSWAQIDVQLKRRYDLIQNLVEVVKGYASYEKEIFEKLAELRARAISSTSVRDIGEVNNQISTTLKTLFAVAERYPELKADKSFLKLQEELVNTENKIAFARQFYNDIVMQFNSKQQMIPDMFVAKLMGLTPKEYYMVEEEVRKPTKVQF